MSTFFILLLCFYLGGNAYVFIRAKEAAQGFPLWIRIVSGAMFWSVALLFFLFFLLRKSSFVSPWAGHLIHQLTTGWLVFTLYMVLLLAAVDLLRLCRILHTNMFWPVLSITIGILLWGHYKYLHPVTKTVEIRIEKPMEGAVQTLNVVAVSDIHLGYGTNRKVLSQHVAQIMQLRPDLILIGGDLIDNSVVPLYHEKMWEELSLLHAPLGIYMVPGNHEYISGIEESARFIREKTSITLLMDSIVVLPNGLQIAGRDDRSNRTRRSVKELLYNYDQSRGLILLDHQPYQLEKAADAGVDLQFSGHTHRGQIWPVSLIADHLFELSHGYIRKGASQFYVSSGLSLWGPPFRIGTDSELMLFRITFSKT